MNNLIARGKPKGQKDFWIEGNLVLDNENNPVIIKSLQKEYAICDSDGTVRFSEVYKNSVAIKTGLLDKDDNNIWGSIEIDSEMTKGGSILNFKADKKTEDGGKICGTMGFHSENASIVEYNEIEGCFYVVGCYYKPLSKFLATFLSGASLNIYVVGNGYDNPELLEDDNEN